MVVGLSCRFQVNDLRHFGANGDIKAQGRLRTALERVVRERVGGQLQILRDLLRGGRSLGRLVIDDAVVHVDEVDLAFERVRRVGKGDLKGLLHGFGLDGRGDGGMVDTENLDAVVFDLAGFLIVVEGSLFRLLLPGIAKGIGDVRKRQVFLGRDLLPEVRL